MTVPARLPLSRLSLAATGWLTLLCTDLVAAAAPLRILVVSAYLLLGPGAALLRPLRPALRGSAQPTARPAPDAPAEGDAETAQNLLLVVLLSLSALVIAATALMLAGAFSGTGTLVLLAAVTSVAALCPALRPSARA